MNTHFQKVDLNQELPYLNETFDKIYSNLVISYLNNPVNTLKELLRTLKKGGTLVVTTLKKDADLCMVYRRFIEKASDPAQIEEARNVLSNASNVMYRESQGVFRFYDINEFKSLFKNVNPELQVSIEYTFANQALIAYLKK